MKNFQEVFNYCFIDYDRDRKVSNIDSILENINTDTFEGLNGIVDNIFDIPINQQVCFINRLLEHYGISSESTGNKNLERFLAKKDFKYHRDFLAILAEDDFEFTEENNRKLTDMWYKINCVVRKFKLRKINEIIN